MENPTDHEQFLTADYKPISPVDLPCVVEYTPEDDTLWLGNGGPAHVGTDIFLGVIAFLGDDRRFVNGLMIDGAKALLLPALFGTDGKDGKPVIDYDRELDTLCIWNRDGTGVLLENAAETLRPYLFPEQSATGG